MAQAVVRREVRTMQEYPYNPIGEAIDSQLRALHRPEPEPLIVGAIAEVWKDLPLTVRTLHRWGWSKREIANRLQMNLKRVRRILKREQ